MVQKNGIPAGESKQFGRSPTVIEIERQGDVCVLRCRGSLLAGLDADYVQAKIEDIKQLKCTRVLADFRNVPSIGSAGIAFIVGVYTSIVKTAGGRFVLTGPAPLVQRVLDITKLSSVIPVAPDVGSGLAALSA